MTTNAEIANSATRTLITNARLITPAGRGPGYRRGDALAALHAIDPGEILFDSATAAIIALGPAGSVNAPHAQRIDAAGCVLMPAFIDAHTHALWAGDRLDEWEMKRRGATYLEILQAGGGIMSTVRAVRDASPEALTNALLERLNHALTEGTMTIEVKSGYGLDTATELKMLRAITDANAQWPGTVVPTACLGHAIDAPAADPQACAAFVQQTIAETLPAIHAAYPTIAIDAYCEQGAWSLQQTIALFEAAIALGHPIRVHTDQFNELGMTNWAVAHGARSVDHLEASSPATLARVAASDTAAVLLPCAGFHVDGRYADGKALAAQGAAIVIASNCNPGSAPTSSMPLTIALAVRGNNLTAAQAITACTANAAALLGLNDRGRLEPGCRADLILLRHRDERQLGYQLGGNPVTAAWCSGKAITPTFR